MKKKTLLFVLFPAFYNSLESFVRDKSKLKYTSSCISKKNIEIKIELFFFFFKVEHIMSFCICK